MEGGRERREVSRGERGGGKGVGKEGRTVGERERGREGRGERGEDIRGQRGEVKNGGKEGRKEGLGK